MNPLRMVQKDLNNFKITKTMDQISTMKSNSFRKLMKQACREYSFNELIAKIGSKGSNLMYTKLKTAKYFSPKLTVKQSQLLFKIRSQMLNVKDNFKNNYITDHIKLPEAILCTHCSTNSIESQEHVIECAGFNQPYKIKYNDLFSSNIDIVTDNIKKN